MARDLFVLIPHPDSEPPPGVSVQAGVALLPGGVLEFSFELQMAPDTVSIPSLASSEPVHGLWQHTCLEAFVASDSQSGYVELNLSPSREWMIYEFSEYRVPAAIGATAPEISVKHAPDRVSLTARVRVQDLPPALHAGTLRIGLSAVVEGSAGQVSYWALAHREGPADFHDRQRFLASVEVLDG